MYEHVVFDVKFMNGWIISVVRMLSTAVVKRTKKLSRCESLEPSGDDFHVFYKGVLEPSLNRLANQLVHPY